MPMNSTETYDGSERNTDSFTCNRNKWTLMSRGANKQFTVSFWTCSKRLQVLHTCMLSTETSDMLAYTHGCNTLINLKNALNENLRRRWDYFVQPWTGVSYVQYDNNRIIRSHYDSHRLSHIKTLYLHYWILQSKFNAYVSNLGGRK